MKPHPSHVFAVLDGDRRCRYCFAESDWPLIESRCADAPRRKVVAAAPVVSCFVVVDCGETSNVFFERAKR